MSSTKALLALAVGLGIVWLGNSIKTRRKRNPKGLPLPPGPKGWPILGNIFDLPMIKQWEAFHQYRNQYGNIVYFDIIGQPMIMLGSLDHCKELLDKRAAINSTRPPTAMIGLIDMNWNFGTMFYGPKWRQYRRAFHQHLNMNAVHAYHGLIHEERDYLCNRLEKNPESFFAHLHLYFGTTIMRASYGFEDDERNAVFVKNAQDLVDAIGAANTPGLFLVNRFPIMQYLPAWFPGAGFKAHGNRISKISYINRTLPFQYVKESMAKGVQSTYPNIATSLLSRLDDLALGDKEREEYEEMVRAVAAVAYIGGADTTVTSAISGVYALATHPDVRRKAQEELDRVCGDRMPMATDRAQLPYIQAIVKEMGRWHSVVPLGAAHASEEDDEYMGYFIPKGTYIMFNSWAIMHDPEVFDKPFEFNPDRYMKDGQIDPTVPDPEIAAFGFGRRICPGRFFSNEVLFTFIAAILYRFDITPPKDENGNEMHVEFDMRSETVAKPYPYKVDWTPRARPSAATAF